MGAIDRQLLCSLILISLDGSLGIGRHCVCQFVQTFQFTPITLTGDLRVSLAALECRGECLVFPGLVESFNSAAWLQETLLMHL